MTAFKDLGLSDNIVEALDKKGFVAPTPIQEQTIPTLLSGERDILGQAATGTGKTAAFGLPIVELCEENARRVQALVLCPTRELAVQVSRELSSFRGAKRLSTFTIYGGQAFGPQFQALNRGVDIVVGTPGRVLDHVRRGSLKLSDLTFLVLDEADEMLDMGFLDDIEEVMSQCPEERRTLLFSATMPQEIKSIATRFMREHDVVKVAKKSEEKANTQLIFHEVAENQRFDALTRVIDGTDEFYGLVFCRTRADVDEVAGRLADKGYAAEGLHGDVSQARREKVLHAFRKRRTRVLVATDVAARGIDVPDLTHVVNYALPQDPESYVHRVGRTGRAGKEGIAATIIAPFEFRKLMWMTAKVNMKPKKKELPSGNDIVTAKKERIFAELREEMESGKHWTSLALAEELLEQAAPAEIIAAMLQANHGKTLDPASYPEIAAPDHSRQPGKMNLFMGNGRVDGVNLQKFLDFIRKETGINPSKIQGVRVFNKHTIFSAPSREGQYILDHFRKVTAGRPLIRKDMPKKGGFNNKGGAPRKNSGKGGYGKTSGRDYRKGGYRRSDAA